MKFIQKNKIKILFLTILLLAFLMRFYKVTQVPPSLYWDEVSQGYNAYSLLTTGHDEHGEFMPVARLIAFGDYKAPVYTYLIIPFMTLFGKNELAVRLPSVVFGTLTVMLTFFLTREIFSKHKNKIAISLLAMFFVAISPWHVQLSRAAYEGNIATFFTVFGLFLFFYSVKKKSFYLVFSVISFVLAFYSFNAHRVFIPLLVLFLSIIYFKDILKSKKTAIVSVLIGVILLIPYIMFFLSPESRLRFQEVNIFSDLSIIEQSNEWRTQDDNSILARALHNRRVLYGLNYIENYFDFYNPNFLFLEGDINPRFSHRSNGQLYLWQLPLILLGIYSIAKGRKKTSIFIFGYILLVPVAASSARETPHALRAEMFVPMLGIITAAGAVFAFCYLKQKNKLLLKICVSAFILLVIYSLFAFTHNYLAHFPKEFSYNWQYGYKKAVLKVEKIKDNYDTIYFTKDYGRPYIYVLFYGDVSPHEYRQNAEIVRDVFGFYNINKYKKYNFVKEIPKSFTKNTLVVSAPDEVPQDFKVIDTVNFLNGKKAFILSTNKK